MILGRLSSLFLVCAILAGFLAWIVYLGGNLILPLVPQEWFEEDGLHSRESQELGLKSSTRNENILLMQAAIKSVSTFLSMIGVTFCSLAAMLRKRNIQMNLTTGFNLFLAVPGLYLILTLKQVL
jgi:hypothetical protein